MQQKYFIQKYCTNFTKNAQIFFVFRCIKTKQYYLEKFSLKTETLPQKCSWTFQLKLNLWLLKTTSMFQSITQHHSRWKMCVQSFTLFPKNTIHYLLFLFILYLLLGLNLLPIETFYNAGFIFCLKYYLNTWNVATWFILHI